MKAIRLERPGSFANIQLDEPGKPGAGEALVRVHRVGMCGTDVSAFHGKMPLLSYPRILGHELGVEVLEVGAGVSNVKPGDRCAVNPYMNCQECFACKRGRSNCCEKLQVLGVHIDGGMRPRFILPARKLHNAGKLQLDQIPLVETLGIGFHAVERGAPAAGEEMLVIGAGPIGLATMQFAKVRGARLTVLDISAERLAFAKTAMGVDETVVADGSEKKKLDAAFAVVIDATGSAASMSYALNYCAHSGRLVYVGLTSDLLQFPHVLMHRRELTLCASRNALPAELDSIIKLIEDGTVNTKPWITHRTALDGYISDFTAAIKPGTGLIKLMVEVNE